MCGTAAGGFMCFIVRLIARPFTNWMKKRIIKQEIVAALIVTILIGAAEAIKHVYGLDQQRLGK
jgi:hypothetical protein